MELADLQAEYGDDVEVIDRRLTAYGAAAEYMMCEDREVVLDSGARTGKSFSAMWKSHLCAENYPGSRQLWMRETRVSMNTTILPDFENEILYPGHPALGSRTLENRTDYTYPNGSAIILAGADKYNRLLSAKFDRFTMFQAEEIRLAVFEKMLTRLSAFKTPYQQATLDVNPDVEDHWINLRPEQFVCVRNDYSLPEGEMCTWYGDPAPECPKCGAPTRRRMTRICYRHQDNPLLWDHEEDDWTPEGRIVMNNLNQTTGVVRKRLLEHQWCAAEGQVWPQYDAGVHRIVASVENRKETQEFFLHLEGEERPIKIEFFGASLDFGYRAPGCLQVWAVDGSRRSYRVAEVYYAEKELDWWAEVCCELYETFPFVVGIADCAEPRSIEHLNDRMGPVVGRDVSRLWNPCDKSQGQLAGLNMVRWALAPGADKDPMVYLVKDAFPRGWDPGLREGMRATCTEKEIPSYVLLRSEGRPNQEKLEKDERPDPTCADHGCNAMQYWLEWLWRKDPQALAPLRNLPAFPPGSVGADWELDKILRGEPTSWEKPPKRWR